MATFIHILQILCAVGLVVLMAVQTDKAEQGGVMGIGGQGGRAAGEIDMAVGPERILKPATKWIAVGFLFLCVLGAVRNPNIFHFLGFLVAYALVFVFGDRLWVSLTGSQK